MDMNQVPRVVTVLLLVIAFFMLIPFFLSLYYDEREAAKSFLFVIIAIVVLSAAVLSLTRKSKRKTLPTRAGFLMVTLSWGFAALFSALPFYLSGAIPRFTDCFFESMSGYTTTGATILTEIESLPMSILFWRSLTHWLGGMGIVVLTVALLPILGVGGLQLMRAEAPGPTVDKITPKIAESAKMLWLIYLGLTVAETLLLFAGGMSLFDSFTHTFGTLATGGFSPKNSSVGFYNSAYIDAVVTVFMLLAGTNFTIYYRLIKGKAGPVLRNTELRAYLGIFITAMLIMTVTNNGMVYDSFGKSARYAGFQAATILTTTGFTTTDYTQWPMLSQTVLFILMFIGGSTGSTGGGIKVMRIATLFKQGWNELRYLIYPRGVFTVKIDGSSVKREIVYSISGFVFFYLTLLLFTTFVVATGGNGIPTSLSTALVTLGNIGPGFGKIGPAMNYAHYPDYIKWYLSFIMMTGRLEIYTVVILFAPMFWKR
jgi:trk system potassium uptake protein TrkH